MQTATILQDFDPSSFADVDDFILKTLPQEYARTGRAVHPGQLFRRYCQRFGMDVIGSETIPRRVRALAQLGELKRVAEARYIPKEVPV